MPYISGWKEYCWGILLLQLPTTCYCLLLSNMTTWAWPKRRGALPTPEAYEVREHFYHKRLKSEIQHAKKNKIQQELYFLESVLCSHMLQYMICRQMIEADNTSWNIGRTCFTSFSLKSRKTCWQDMESLSIKLHKVKKNTGVMGTKITYKLHPWKVILLTVQGQRKLLDISFEHCEEIKSANLEKDQ